MISINNQPKPHEHKSIHRKIDHTETMTRPQLQVQIELLQDSHSASLKLLDELDARLSTVLRERCP